MDHNRFDALAISVSRATSRRQLLKAAIGGGAGAAITARLPRRAFAQTPTPSSTATPPNFSFLVPLPTDPDLSDFGLNQKLTGPPTVFRSAKAMTILPDDLKPVLSKNMKSSYVSTIATTRNGNPDDTDRAITTTVFDFGTEKEARNVWEKYSQHVTTQPGVEPVNAAGDSDDTVVFGGCFSACIDLSSPAPTASPPAQQAFAVGQRGRFVFDARISDFSSNEINGGDIESIAVLVDNKLQLAAPAGGSLGERSIGSVASRLLSFASTAVAPLARVRRRNDTAEDLLRILVPQTTLPIFGYGDGAVPKTASQWLIVDAGEIVKSYGEAESAAEERLSELTGVIYAFMSSQSLPTDTDYADGYEIKMLVVEYALANLQSIDTFKNGAIKRLARRRPHMTAVTVESSNKLQVFAFEDPDTPHGSLFGVNRTRYFTRGNDVFAVMTEVCAVPKSDGRAPLSMKALQDDILPSAAHVADNLTDCIDDPETCGTTRRIDLPPSLSCPDGQIKCSGACVDPTSDTANCGKCGFICAQRAVCDSGNCICSPGTTYCGNGICTDLTQDPVNCGACGNACVAGVCNGGVCPDFTTDPNNCGAAGNVCPRGEPCVGGQCGCPSGQQACGNTCADLSADVKNCGQCGVVCGDPLVCYGGSCLCPDGSPVCGNDCCDPASEVCTGSACASCSGMLCPGGACVDPMTDPNNCGNCGNSCGSLTCCSGACSDLQNDDKNCGWCGNDCGAGMSCSYGDCYPIIN